MRAESTYKGGYSFSVRLTGEIARQVRDFSIREEVSLPEVVRHCLGVYFASDNKLAEVKGARDFAYLRTREFYLRKMSAFLEDLRRLTDEEHRFLVQAAGITDIETDGGVNGGHGQ